jgi:hypothetical protein
MNSRRRLLKLLGLVAISRRLGRLAQAESAKAADPSELPYFLRWPGTPEVHLQLQKYGQMASCNQGKGLLKRLIVLTMTNEGEPMVLTQPPPENGTRKLQLGIAFDLGFHHREADSVRAYTSFGGAGVVYDLKLATPDKPEFWTQPVLNVEQENDPNSHPSFREELGLPETARFAIRAKNDTYEVLGYLGLWFTATFEGGKLVSVRETQPAQEMPLKYLDVASNSK